MDKQAVRVVKGDEMVSQLPRKFSRIEWYFLARSGEISVEVIGRRQCGRIDLKFHGSLNLTPQTK